MQTSQFLRELAPLRHSERARKMVETGRLARDDAQWRTVLDELETGESYERRLCLQACHGERDGARAARFIGDESRLIRSRALEVAATVCDDEQLREIFAGLKEKARRRLLVFLEKRGRRAAIDALIFDLRAQNGEWHGLLARASRGVAEQLWPEGMARASAEDWARFGRRHPLLAFEALQSSPNGEGVTVEALNAVLRVAAPRFPDEALQTVRKLSQQLRLRWLESDVLLVRRPREFLELALELGQGLEISLTNAAGKVPLDLLLQVAERRPKWLGYSLSWFPRLKPEARGQIFEVIGRGWRNDEGVIDDELVALLPREWRQTEARRHLELPTLVAQPARRLDFAAFLDWDEALAEISPLLNDPKPENRIAAHLALGSAIRFDRTKLGAWLAMLEARGNEQDPVRNAMMESLCDQPPGRWQSEHLPTLGRLIRRALDASDLSAMTASHAEKLVVALLPFHPEWALEWIAILVKERGQVHFYGLEHRINDADTRRLTPVLNPILTQWAKRDRQPQLLSLATAFGKRIKVWDELALAVEQLARGSQWNVQAALQILQEQLPKRFAELVPRLLKDDESYAIFPVVYEFLHLARQDLLAHLTRSGCGRVVSSVNTIRFWLRRSHVQDFSSRISRSQHPTTTRPRKVSCSIHFWDAAL